jgi:hypothetical protein
MVTIVTTIHNVPNDGKVHHKQFQVPFKGITGSITAYKNIDYRSAVLILVKRKKLNQIGAKSGSQKQNINKGMLDKIFSF